MAPKDRYKDKKRKRGGEDNSQSRKSRTSLGIVEEKLAQTMKEFDQRPEYGASEKPNTNPNNVPPDVEGSSEPIITQRKEHQAPPTNTDLEKYPKDPLERLLQMLEEDSNGTTENKDTYNSAITEIAEGLESKKDEYPLSYYYQDASSEDEELEAEEKKQKERDTRKADAMKIYYDDDYLSNAICNALQEKDENKICAYLYSALYNELIFRDKTDYDSKIKYISKAIKTGLEHGKTNQEKKDILQALYLGLQLLHEKVNEVRNMKPEDLIAYTDKDRPDTPSKKNFTVLSNYIKKVIFFVILEHDKEKAHELLKKIKDKKFIKTYIFLPKDADYNILYLLFKNLNSDSANDLDSASDLTNTLYETLSEGINKIKNEGRKNEIAKRLLQAYQKLKTDKDSKGVSALLSLLSTKGILEDDNLLYSQDMHDFRFFDANSPTVILVDIIIDYFSFDLENHPKKIEKPLRNILSLLRITSNSSSVSVNNVQKIIKAFLHNHDHKTKLSLNGIFEKLYQFIIVKARQIDQFEELYKDLQYALPEKVIVNDAKDLLKSLIRDFNALFEIGDLNTAFEIADQFCRKIRHRYSQKLPEGSYEKTDLEEAGLEETELDLEKETSLSFGAEIMIEFHRIIIKKIIEENFAQKTRDIKGEGSPKESVMNVFFKSEVFSEAVLNLFFKNQEGIEVAGEDNTTADDCAGSSPLLSTIERAIGEKQKTNYYHH